MRSAGEQALPDTRARHSRAADEVFLSSTGGGILPIARLDGKLLPHFPGPIATRLYDAYWALHDEPAYRDPVDYGSLS